MSMQVLVLVVQNTFLNSQAGSLFVARLRSPSP